MKYYNNALSKIFIFFVLALVFCGTLSAFGCSGNEISYVNYRWGLSLPTAEELIYSYEDEGFGDATHYYVLNVSMDSLNINFSKVEEEQAEAITVCYSSLSDDVDSQYRVDFSHDIYVYYETKNDGFDKIYLLYDYNLSRLVIFEMY